MGWKTGLNIYGKAVALNMPHQKLIRVLNYVWLLVVFPVAVAILVGVLGHSVIHLLSEPLIATSIVLPLIAGFH